MPIEPGDMVVMTGAWPVALGSNVHLMPGDRGKLVRLGQRHCAVEFHGVVVVVPRSHVRIENEPPDASSDGWWDDIARQLGDRE